MPKNVRSLLLSCLDEFAELEKNQALLEIALEQFADFPESPQQVRDRLEVLIESYRCFADKNLNQIQADLESLRCQLLGGE